jgi:hypothetical protein
MLLNAIQLNILRQWALRMNRIRYWTLGFPSYPDLHYHLCHFAVPPLVHRKLRCSDHQFMSSWGGFVGLRSDLDVTVTSVSAFHG